MATEATTSDPATQPEETSQVDEQATQTGAVDETKDTSQSSDSPSEPQADNSELTAEEKEWADKKGLPLDDPIKLARMYRESERALGKKGSEERHLKEAVDSANTMMGADDLQALNNRISAVEFLVSNPDAVPYVDKMVQVLEDEPGLASRLDLALKIAKADDSASREVAARQAGEKEARERAANAGRAALPKASASQPGYDSAKITPENVNQIVGQHLGDRAWYEQHKAEIDAALS